MQMNNEIKVPVGRGWALSGPVLAALVLTGSNLLGFTDFPWGWVIATALISWILLLASVFMVISLVAMSFLIRWTSARVFSLESKDGEAK